MSDERAYSRYSTGPAGGAGEPPRRAGSRRPPAERSGRERPPGSKERRPRRSRVPALIVLGVVILIIGLVGTAVAGSDDEGEQTGRTVPVRVLPLTTVLPSEGRSGTGAPIIQAPTMEVPEAADSGAVVPDSEAPTSSTAVAPPTS